MILGKILSKKLYGNIQCKTSTLKDFLIYCFILPKNLLCETFFRFVAFMLCIKKVSPKESTYTILIRLS